MKDIGKMENELGADENFEVVQNSEEKEEGLRWSFEHPEGVLVFEHD